MNRLPALRILPAVGGTGFKKITILAALCAPLSFQAATTSLLAQDAVVSSVEPVDEAAQLQKRKNVAVALNYCRASFHRIRKYPTAQVMEEEQQKILNNLNLNGIQDEQIIRLYAEVLDEIGQIQLSEKESELFETKYKRAVRQELVFDSLSVGLDLVTGQYLGAVRTGASGWWDYRTFSWNRDNEILKIEKTRVNSVVKKSTSFLDTFWKMTQANQIPDRWLVRSSDLDELETAMNENDPQIRLRILRRMEPYMECYPPYWYYLARTQQAVGDLMASMGTFERLAGLADGHFRRDDMMASALANQAVIQAYLGNPESLQTAERALSYSTQVWEANLACARILQRAGRVADAEDAILRNLDVGLETEQSTISLLSFYYDTNNATKLAQYLADEKVLVKIPPPVLIRYASLLNEQETPGLIWTALASSMKMEPQVGFGSDSIVLTCHPVWRISRSKIGLHTADGRLIPGELTRQGEYDVIRFANVGEFGSVLTGPTQLPELKLEVQYGEKEPIQLAFSEQSITNPATSTLATTTTVARAPTEMKSYSLTAAQWGERQLANVQPLPRTVALPQPPAVSQKPQVIEHSTAELGKHANSGSAETRTAIQETQKAKQAADSLIR